MIEELLAPLVPDRFVNDQNYRNGHIRIINALPGTEILGLHIPEMKSVAKGLSCRTDAGKILADFEASSGQAAGFRHDRHAGNLCHEEHMIWGFMLNRMKMPLEERMEHLKAFIPNISNWAVCDSFCSDAKWVQTIRRRPGTEEARLWEFISGYFGSVHEFEVRFATIMSMCHFMDIRYLHEIFGRFDALDFSCIISGYSSADAGGDTICSNGLAKAAANAPYYVRMGVAWFLATSLAKYPAETREYAGNSRLPEDVIRLYVRKARESFRTRDMNPFG